MADQFRAWKTTWPEIQSFWRRRLPRAARRRGDPHGRPCLTSNCDRSHTHTYPSKRVSHSHLTPSLPPLSQPQAPELKFEIPAERPLPRTSEGSTPPRRLRTPELQDTSGLEAVTPERLWSTLLVSRPPARHADRSTNAAGASRAPTPSGLRSQAIFESVGATGQPNSSTSSHGQHQRPQRVAAVSCARLGGDDAPAGPPAPK